MPDEVVEEGDFDGGGSGEEVAAGQETREEGQGGKLDGHADGSDEVELAPTQYEAHDSGSGFGSGSSR